MMTGKKFDPKRLHKLNDPQRLVDIPPDYVCDKLDVEKPDILVEIGAGTAFFSVAFSQYLKASTIYACDVSEVMINWIKENVSPMHPGVIAVKSDEAAVPIGDGISDLVFTINLHHELESPTLTVQEAYRILKPGGSIFIVDWEKRQMAEGPPEKIRCLPEEVGEELLGAGFSGVSVFNELPKHFLVVGRKAF